MHGMALFDLFQNPLPFNSKGEEQDKSFMAFAIKKAKIKFQSFPSKYLLFGIFILSLSLRILYINSLLKTNPFFDYPIVDSEVYHKWALDIKNGDLLGKEIFYLSPGYAYFLALIYKIFGVGFYPVYLVQALIDSLSAIMILMIGKTSFSKGVGLLASLLWTFYGPSAFYSGKIAAEPLGIFLLLTALLTLSKANKKKRSPFYFIAGLLLGLATITRTYWLLLVPFWIVTIYLLSPLTIKRRLIVISTFLSGISFIIAPITFRNILVAGEAILISGNSGLIFYSGNNPRARGFSTYIDGVSLNVKEQWEDSKMLAEKELKRPLTRKEVDRYWRNKAIKFIIENPKDYIILLGKKILAGLSGQERSTMYFIEIEKGITPFIKIFFINFYMIMPLGITGIFICGNIKRDSHILSIPLTHLIIIIIFMAESRYRLPAVPVLCLFASCLILKSGDLLKKWQQGVPVLILLCGFSLYQYINSHFSPHKPPEIFYNLGNAYLHKGDPKKAMENYNIAFSLRPSYPELLNNMGNAHYLMGNESEAIKLWKEAYRLKPNYLVPLYNLAKIYQTKDPERAKEYWINFLILSKDMKGEAKYREEGERFLRENEYIKNESH
jgi:4-amino-4-deoxy-L-arabinose transferase-like glycosyltransferase